MTSLERSEPQRVKEVAGKYQAWGYEIILEPSVEHLPDFLQGYRPDFIARRGGETVLVEVKVQPSSAELAHYRDLADKVHEHPGWRLDLVVTNPPDRIPIASDYPVLPTDDISRRFAEAEHLVVSGHNEAAYLMAWAAIEATLRLLAERNAVDVQRSATPTLLKQLVSLGVISRLQYNTLWDSYQRRSALAHGFASREDSSAPRSLIAFGNELLRTLHQAA